MKLTACVASVTPFRETSVSGRKFAPFSVSVHVLVVALVLVGLIELSVGTGLFTSACTVKVRVPVVLVTDCSESVYAPNAINLLLA